MNYNVILDEQKLIDYINWLPELDEGERFYCCLFARKKYCKDIKYIKSDKSQLKRFVTTKDLMLSKIQQLECPVGSYVQKGGTVIPQEALALYVMPNPRSLYKACKNSLIELVNIITREHTTITPHQIALSHIQKAPSRKEYMDFDFDDMDWNDMIDEIVTYINKDALSIMKTRGGFHLLVEMKKIQPEYSKTWYTNLSKLGHDVKGDNLLPVPGCVQGGFNPILIQSDML